MVITTYSDGHKNVSFGKTVDQWNGINEGDAVEYSEKPAQQEGRDPMCTFVKKAGASGGSSAPSKPSGGKSWSNESDDERRLSIFFSYAKDLVAAGVIKSPVASPIAVADLIGTVTDALLEKFNAMRKAKTASPAPSPAPVEEPAPF